MTVSEKVEGIRKHRDYFLRCAVRERDLGNDAGCEAYASYALNYNYLINRILEDYPDPGIVDGYEHVAYTSVILDDIAKKAGW